MVGKRRRNTRPQAPSRAVALPGSQLPSPHLPMSSSHGCGHHWGAPSSGLTSWVPRALLVAVEQESLVKVSVFTPCEHEGNYV